MSTHLLLNEVEDGFVGSYYKDTQLRFDVHTKVAIPEECDYEISWSISPEIYKTSLDFKLKPIFSPTSAVGNKFLMGFDLIRPKKHAKRGCKFSISALLDIFDKKKEEPSMSKKRAKRILKLFDYVNKGGK